MQNRLTLTQSRRAARAVLALIVALALISCDGIALPGSAPAGNGAAAPNMLQSIVQATPEDTVRGFIEAWGRRDYEAMYAAISAESQSLIAAPTFRAVYEAADDALSTSAAAATTRPALIQGITAAVPYDLALTSATFGQIEDAGRTMRLVRAPGNEWRIAWSQMDIFDGYAPGTRLDALLERAPRGNLLDRNGRLVVEQGGTVTTLFLARQEVPDGELCLDLLSILLRQERAGLVTELNRYNPETVFAVGDIDTEEYNARAPELASTCAIRTSARQTRSYVGHGISAHITGYVGQIPPEELEGYQARGYSADALVGRTGVEAAYEDELAGEASSILRIIEPGGLIVRELAGATGTTPQDVTLTIDVNLQRTAAQALSDAYNYAAPNWGNRTHSPGGGLVVLNVQTGAVLAMASYPSFDPGVFSPDTPYTEVFRLINALTSDTRQPFFNRVTQGSYAPGSSFKIITTAAAASERVFPPNEVFYCDMQWDGRPFGDTASARLDWRASEMEEFRFPTGEITMSGALTSSCNPFFYQMGALLYNERGATALTDYARRMGLGRATGLAPIVPETAGQIVPPTSVEQAINIAIGQHETQVTIVQMARVAAGIANGGTLVAPYLVERVGTPDGETTSFQAAPVAAGSMGLRDDVLALVREGMCNVTRAEVLGRTTGVPLGTAWFVFDDSTSVIAPYSVCAKTGTAQTGRVEPQGWFVAYAPADNPQIAVAAMIEHGREGSETAAPIVRRVMDAYFNAQPAPYPGWWNTEYVAMNIPAGSTGG